MTRNNLMSARKQLTAIWNGLPANAPFTDQDGDASWGPVVLCEITTWRDFHRWLDRNQELVPRECNYEPFNDGTDKGKVVIVLPGSPLCIIGEYGQVPDQSLIPVNLTVGGEALVDAYGLPFPNVVVEVVYKNDELAKLRAKLERWMHPRLTSVQVAIGIKIFAGGRNPLRRVAILHQRGQPTREVEFGLDSPRPPVLVLTFPLAAVYHGVALPGSLADLDNPEISIDLVTLRTMIEGLIELCFGA